MHYKLRYMLHFSRARPAIRCSLGIAACLLLTPVVLLAGDPVGSVMSPLVDDVSDSPQGLDAASRGVIVRPDQAFHTRFAGCDTDGLTPNAFLARISAIIDGSETCVPPNTINTGFGDVTICHSPDCPNGTEGCPVVLTANPAAGDFNTGLFQVPGGIEDVSVPIDGPLGKCMLQVTNVAGTYQFTYSIQSLKADAVFVAFMIDAVTQVVDFSYSGCSDYAIALGTFTDQLVADIEEGLSKKTGLEVANDTVFTQVCPL